MGKKDKKEESSSSSSESEEEKKEKKEKKVKVVKPKQVFLTPQSFSKRYDSLYNNKNLSDVFVKFEGSGEVIPAHKIVLSTHSEGIL
jgi:hypothetical protein